MSELISTTECGLAIGTLAVALNERDAEIRRLREILRDRGWQEGTAQWAEWECRVADALDRIRKLLGE